MTKETSFKNIVIIAPHPDDETLGCGGTLLKHKTQGDNIFCIFVTNISEEFGFKKEVVEKRQDEINEVSKKYGFTKHYCLNYPTTKLTQSDTGFLIGDISKIFNEIEPERVYLPFYGDVHSDHRIIFDASIACTKSFRYPFVKEVLMYETVSETDFSPINKFSPNYFNNIEQYFCEKIEIMKIYESEIQEDNLPRSLKNMEAIASYRGSNISRKYAESFQIIKFIND